jgi:membrane protease YdiL (CAAX protease family)
MELAFGDAWLLFGVDIDRAYQTILYGVCVGACFILVQLYVFHYKEIAFVELKSDKLRLGMLRPLVFTFVTPFAEEAFFRGFFQRSLQQFAGVGISIAVTSGAFVLTHRYWRKTAKDALFLVFSAFMLSIIAALTGNIIGSIIAHSMNNSPAAFPIFRYIAHRKAT